VAHVTARTFYDPMREGQPARAVELGDIVVLDGRRGYVSAIGRKFVTVKIYGGKPAKVDPLASSPVWTGEQHV